MNESKPPEKMHILLVEDNEHDRAAFRRALSKSEIHCQLTECQKAEEALELLQSCAESFNLVVIDFGLPGMSGLELFKKIHDDGQHPPFMMLTGSGSEHLAVEALKSGVSDYIVKDPKHGYLQLLPVVIKEVLQRHQDRLARQRAEKALKESEEKVRRQFEEIETIYRSAGVGLCVLDKDLRFVKVNERLAEMNGVPAEHHFGRTVREIVPGLADIAESLAERVFRTGEPIQDLEILGTTACQPDVQRYWIEQWNPLKDAFGNVIAINIAAEEITERKRFEEKLKQTNQELEARIAERTSTLAATIQVLEAEIVEREAAEQALSDSEKQYSTLVRNSLTGIFIEQNGRIAFANERFANIYGYSKEELAGMDVLDLVHPEDRRLIREITKKRLSGVAPTSEYDARGITKTGDTIWIQRRNTLIDHQGSPAILCNHIDITKRKQLESSLRENEQKLRLLSTRLLSAQEEERKRVARELHDSISSSLTAINMGLAHILEMVGGESEPAVSINNLISITGQTMDEARRMMNALRPSMLDDLGLVTTIGSFCKSFQQIHKSIFIKQLIVAEEGDIPEDLKIVIYRVMQESLHNIAKYAETELVELSFAKKGNKLELIIEDNGIGFDLGAALSKCDYAKGMGLTNMQERTELSGGSFRIQSTPGEGTTIHACWDLAARPEEAWVRNDRTRIGF